MRVVRATILGCVFLLAQAALPAGAGQTVVARAKKGGKKILLNFDGARLVDVVKTISKATGKNFILEDAVRRQKMTIVSGSRVSVEEAYQGFLGALAAEGLQVESEGKFYKISRIRGPEYRAGDVRRLSLEGITKVDSTTWRVKRDTLQDITTHDKDDIAIQARIVPSIKDGKINGFKLFAIRPHSVYTALGIQNGDVVHRINQRLIDSPDKALQVYQELKDADKLVVELTRRGKTRVHTYHLK